MKTSYRVARATHSSASTYWTIPSLTETVEQLVGEDAPVGGPPRAHVDLGNAPNILVSGLSDLHRVDALESTRVSAPEMRPS